MLELTDYTQRIGMLKQQVSKAFLDAGKEFKDLVKDINQNRDDGERFTIFGTRYFLIDDKNVLPKCMKIYLEDKIIDCTVNNNPKIIRNIR